MQLLIDLGHGEREEGSSHLEYQTAQSKGRADGFCLRSERPWSRSSNGYSEETNLRCIEEIEERKTDPQLVS